ncbi:MAG: NUDIX hydrolase [Dermatophilaceae bacterium]
MGVGETTQKVACYIVQAGRLLVFRHLDEAWDESGLQVPAGTIERSETPEAAALREASEETGLTTLHIVRKVGESRYDMAPYRSETHHRHVFHLEIDETTPERWVSVEDDPDDGSEPRRFECYWIPLAQGHVLSGGQGAFLGSLLTEKTGAASSAAREPDVEAGYAELVAARPRAWRAGPRGTARRRRPDWADDE